jgi:hypothetical protein
MNGLVDLGTSMLSVLTTMVKKLSLMHRVTRIFSYKTTLGSSFRHWVASMKLLIKVDCEVHCNMTFMVVDMDSYDVLLGFQMFYQN